MTILIEVALVLAALFTGAAGYISLVEHPARLELEDGPLLRQWRPSYARALPIQAGLAIGGGVAGLGAGYVLGDWRCVLGSVVLLANWPFTLLVIMPVNKRLKAIDAADLGETRHLLKRWGRLHDGRSILGLTATLIFLWASISSE
ncbi:DUF1772 domain-containing protein [Sphingomonas sp. ID0503]|uniref:DUF1772 domain-containing protein n=1 Tax=Sphingomonas sp. ID0503 TaxID=3399691 RepID=UPI003AFB1C65